jgi:L-amino acid N-acyltransferase YncA
MTMEFRVATIDDADAIRDIYAPYCESSNVSFETVAPTREQMAERITRIREMYPWLVAVTDGRVAGYVYATRFRERAAYRWSVEAAVYIASDQHRRGLGRALYTSLFSILRVQNFSKVVAGITLPNPASVRLHESVGFRSAGRFAGVGHKNGTWLDVGWWQLELQPEVTNPPEPQPFASIYDSPRVAAALAEGQRLVSG